MYCSEKCESKKGWKMIDEPTESITEATSEDVEAAIEAIEEEAEDSDEIIVAES